MGEAKCQVFENREVRLMQAPSGEGIEKDVKNEERSDYVHENTADVDKMYTDRPALIGRKCADYAIDRGEVAPAFRACPESL